MGGRAFLVAVSSLVAGGLAPGVASAQGDTRYVDVLFDEVVVTTNVKYGEAVNSLDETQDLLLDIYEPAGDTETGRGLYIWTHGGNFRVGNKSSNGPLEDYVMRGWVGVSIGYRLRPELPGNAAIGALTNPASLPAFIDATKDAQHDQQAAVRWARANADALRIDPERIAVGGISAGAIISLMTAFNPEDPGDSGTPGESSAVAAAVSHAGAYAPVLLGRAPMPGDPPIAIYHGTNDEQVPYAVAPLACLLTLVALNDCEFMTFIGENHRTLGTDLARDFLYRHVILGRSETRAPLVIDVDGEPVTVLAGAEPAGVDFGATAGVVTPTDPQELQDNTIQLLRYALDALGVPHPF